MPDHIEHKGKIIDEAKSFEVMECSACGFKHLHPIPTQAQLDEFYQTQYYDTHKSDYILTDDKEIAYLEIAYKDRLDRLNRFSKGKTMLDIGCGSGMFLKYAQDRGWKCKGIEPSKLAYEVATEKGLDVANATFNEFVEQNQETYDVVHFKNVLEHVRNPIEILQKCHDLLKPGGLIYMEVPNDYNFFQRWGAKILKVRKSWLAIPDHVNYFSFSSLKRTMQREGYKVIFRDTTFPIYMLLLCGLNFIKHKHHGAKAHKIRVGFEAGLYNMKLNFFKRIIYRCLSFMSLGRTVILYARKIS